MHPSPQLQSHIPITGFINQFHSKVFPINFQTSHNLIYMAFQWLSLVGAIWLQSINGTNSNFPAYSSQLKQILSLSQLQLNNLAFASDAGKLFCWVSGVAAVYLPLWLVLVIGSLLGLIGYGVQFLFLSHQISYLSYAHVVVLTALAGNSICWINTVCYIVAIRNFPLDRQFAVGLSTSYLGLSAKIYTDIVDAVYPSSLNERAKAYLFLSSILPLAVCIIAAPIVRDVNSWKSRQMVRGFFLMFVITIVTGVYAVISSFGLISRRLSPWIVVAGMGVLLFAPLVVPLAEKVMERLQKKCWLRKENRMHHLSLDSVVGVETLEGGPKGEEGIVETPEASAKEEIGAKLMLTRVEFWVYFFVYLSGATLGLVYLNNLGQIAESRGCSSTSSLISLSSSFGFFGRLLPSLMDYFSGTRCKLSGPASIAVMMAPMSGAFLLLVSGENLCLYISTVIIGVCTGAITTLAVSTTSELFGTKNFSINHNIVVANIPIGSFLFGNLAALIYRAQSHGGKDGRCMGMNCYQTTFILWGSLCFLGTLLALVLHVRTKKFYSQ